jgi:hypothetical protein
MAHERNVDFSQEAKTLIQGMLAFDPTERCDTFKISIGFHLGHVFNVFS